jgi:hypothetical protein
LTYRQYSSSPGPPAYETEQIEPAFDMVIDASIIKTMKQYRKVIQNKLLALWMEDYNNKMYSQNYDNNAQKEMQLYIMAKIQELQNIDLIEKLVKLDDNNPEEIKVYRAK